MKELVRRPLGELRVGDIKYDEELAHAKPLVVVGDYSYAKMLEVGLRPHVVVVDAKIERIPSKEPRLRGYEVVRVRNEPGTIQPDAALAVVRAVQKGEGAVVVDGEEDLLTLPAIHALPEGGVVVYGQPRTGYVIVRQSEANKKLVETIVSMSTV
ncbi:MAG: GTP-dependent dephospho-CoA kinase family protein [Candidatus Caldarchaeum sp.]|nr:GTP-dependent dephospho-CoA kinase family protein [Candidatus Caldarchaeum sp.]